MKITLTDAGILQLYEMWSEQEYAAGFVGATRPMVKQFRTWLIDYFVAGMGLPVVEPHELEMLDEFHRQEMEEAPSGRP